MSALLPSHDRPTGVAAAAIPAPRVAPPPETLAPEPAVLPRPRPAAVWGVVAGMAAGAVGTLAAAVIVTAPAAATSHGTRATAGPRAACRSSTAP